MSGQFSDELLERSTAQFAFEERSESPALVFCAIRTAELEHHLAILIHGSGGWRCLEMSGEKYEQSAWVYAAATRDRKLIWAVSDWDVEGPGWDLEITFSSDAGRSWRHVGSVGKPSYLAMFESLQMETRRRGWLSMYLDDAYGALAKGYYTYHTDDGWRHCSGHRYSRREPRNLHHSLLPPSYSDASESCSGLNELKALMAPMEATGRR
jgi:hypothetical protein